MEPARVSPVELMLEVIQEHSPPTIWTGAPLAAFRQVANTNRGDIGEEFVRRYAALAADGLVVAVPCAALWRDRRKPQTSHRCRRSVCLFVIAEGHGNRCVSQTLGRMGGANVVSITIHNLDDDLNTRQPVRTVGNDRSMEEEAQLILRGVVRRDRCREGSGHGDPRWN